MSTFNFEKFPKRGARLVKTPELTIQAKGTLSMNVSAYHALGEPTAVELLYDASQQVIGIQPCPPEAADAYPIRPVGSRKTTGEPNGYLVAGAAFLKYFNIPYGKPERREVSVEDGVLIVDLKASGRLVYSNRKKSVMNKDQAPDS